MPPRRSVGFLEWRIVHPNPPAGCARGGRAVLVRLNLGWILLLRKGTRVNRPTVCEQAPEIGAVGATTSKKELPTPAQSGSIIVELMGS